MVYGGTIKPGYSKLTQQPLDIISAFQSYGALRSGLCPSPPRCHKIGSGGSSIWQIS